MLQLFKKIIYKAYSFAKCFLLINYFSTILRKVKWNIDIKNFLSSSNMGITDKKNAQTDIIISLTSYPERIKSIRYTIYSIMHQSVKPNKIILWLSKNDFASYHFSDKILMAFQKKGLEIHWVEENIGSYKKIFYCFPDLAKNIVVTADDDVFYPHDWLEKLIHSYETNPHNIHCHRAHRINFDENGLINPYAKWDSEIQYRNSIPSILNFATGVGGILYPPNALYHDWIKKEIFLDLCPNTDDIWLWAMSVLNGKKIQIVKDNYTNFTPTNYKNSSLWKKNVLMGGNDLSIKKLLSFYPKLSEKIYFNSNEYWELRYKVFKPISSHKIGPSGAGSYGRLADFKAKILNSFCKDFGIQNVIEWGCGDGNQLSLMKYHTYTGIDVSPTIIERCREKFKNDKTKVFYTLEYFLEQQKIAPIFDLSISLDVIYHLIHDEIYINYMRNLFGSSNKYVIIYSSNKNEILTQHVKHRKFTDWVEANMDNWRLKEKIPNIYPFSKKDPNNTSFADFYIFEKI